MILIIGDNDKPFINQCIDALMHDRLLQYEHRNYTVDRMHVHTENEIPTYSITITPVRIYDPTLR